MSELSIGMSGESLGGRREEDDGGLMISNSLSSWPGLLRKKMTSVGYVLKVWDLCKVIERILFLFDDERVLCQSVERERKAKNTSPAGFLMWYFVFNVVFWDDFFRSFVLTGLLTDSRETWIYVGSAY